MCDFKREKIENKLRVLIEDIRRCHTTAVEVNTYYQPGGSLDQWVVVEVKTLRTLLREVAHMDARQLGRVCLFLYLEEAAIWTIKRGLLIGSIADPLHFQVEHGPPIVEAFMELVKVVTTPAPANVDQVEEAVKTFKTKLAAGLAFLLSCDGLSTRAREWVTYTEDGAVRWPTREDLSCYISPSVYSPLTGR